MADMKQVLQFVIDADGTSATKGFKQVGAAAEAELGKTSDALEDLRTAGQKAADGLKDAAAVMAAELKDTAEASEALSKALGPELASRTDLGKVVSELRGMGLTMDDVKADADVLAAALRELDKVKVDAETTGLNSFERGARDARGATDELTKSAGSSKSVLANMVGNSVQDLGAVGGVAGSAGVAIGQMGEYMADALADGDALGKVLKNFALVSGPIAGLAAITFAVQMYTDAQEKARQKTEELRRAQEEMQQGNETQFIETLALQYGNLVNDLDRAGISTQEFLGFVQDGTPIENFAQRLEESGVAAERGEFGANAYSAALGELRSEFVANEEAIDSNRDAETLLAEAMGVTASVTETLTEEVDGFSEAQGVAQSAIEGATGALQAQNDLLNEGIDKTLDARQANLDYTSAQIDTNAELGNYLSVMNDANSTTDQRVAAGIALEEQLIAEAQKFAEAQQANAEANGEMFTAAQRADAFNQGLETLKGRFPELAPLLDGYKVKLEEIPGNVETTFNANVAVAKSAIQTLIDTINRVPRRLNVSTGGGGSGSGSAQEKAFQVTARGMLTVSEAAKATTRALTDKSKALEFNIDTLLEAGQAERDYAAEAARTEDAVERWTETMNDAEASAAERVAAGVDLENQLVDEAKKFVDWQRAVAEANGETYTAQEQVADYNAALDALKARLPGLSDLLDSYKISIDEVTAATQASTDAFKDQQNALNDAVSDLLGARDADRAYQGEVIDTIRAVDSYNQTLNDAEASALDKQEAALALANQLDDQAEAFVRLKQAQAEAEGKTFTVVERVVAYKEALNQLAKDFPQLAATINAMGLNVSPSGVVSGSALSPSLNRVGARTGSGSQFNITVNAGLGSNGTQIGNEIINAIKAWEQINGPGWRN